MPQGNEPRENEPQQDMMKQDWQPEYEQKDEQQHHEEFVQGLYRQQGWSPPPPPPPSPTTPKSNATYISPRCALDIHLTKGQPGEKHNDRRFDPFKAPGQAPGRLTGAAQRQRMEGPLQEPRTPASSGQLGGYPRTARDIMSSLQVFGSGTSPSRQKAVEDALSDRVVALRAAAHRSAFAPMGMLCLACQWQAGGGLPVREAFFVCPLDTLEFRLQSEYVSGGARGNALHLQTARKIIFREHSLYPSLSPAVITAQGGLTLPAIAGGEDAQDQDESMYPILPSIEDWYDDFTYPKLPSGDDNDDDEPIVTKVAKVKKATNSKAKSGSPASATPKLGPVPPQCTLSTA
ncbi:hypothetical protein GGR56DRAFT_678214 [Xylariaceae sp. FL0804]|nr:hypothetical protein GGR56DRAFT_678214 [Xylariaceae sp. FL0804]